MMSKTKGAVQVEFLGGKIQEGWRITKANFVIDMASAKILLVLAKDGQSSLNEFTWTPELEEFLLLRHPTRMATREEEIIRCANIFSNNFIQSDLYFGNTLTSAVLIQVLKGKPQYHLSEILHQISTVNHQMGDYATKCKEYLESAIQGLQNTLVWTLRYPNDQSTVDLVSEALTIAVDSRFNISLRKNLFPKLRAMLKK